MKRRLLFILTAGMIIYLPATGQKTNTVDVHNQYKVNKWVSASIGVAGTAANFWGRNRLRNKAPIPEQEVMALKKNDVNRLDRVALRQDFSTYEDAKQWSDIGLYTSFLLPGLLFFDDDIRSEWVDISLMYFETQAIAATLYSWSPMGPAVIERFRPFTYYDEAFIEDRTEGRMRNSFFSGHVSTAAAGAFFTVKVYTDYHPALGAKKWLYYGLALLPPALVGWYRIKGLSHFPTDVIAGTVVGAAGGILVPHFHRNKSWNGGVSFIYTDRVKGAALWWRF